MEFDIRAMKQRAKSFFGINRSLWFVGVIWEVFACIYMGIIIGMCDTGKIQLILLSFFIVEMIYAFLRNGFKWYCMEVAREEQCKWNKIFPLFVTKPIAQVILNIIKVISYSIGYMFCYIGFFIPFYCLRFVIYIIRDEEISFFQAIKMNTKILKGHLAELIKLDLSNIGWVALMICTFGIAGFYVKPYMSLIYIEFYDYLKGQYELLGEN